MRYRNHIILDFEMNPTDKRLTRQAGCYLWQEITSHAMSARNIMTISHEKSPT